jgi:hypothetical protein
MVIGKQRAVVWRQNRQMSPDAQKRNLLPDQMLCLFSEPSLFSVPNGNTARQE